MPFREELKPRLCEGVELVSVPVSEPGGAQSAETQFLRRARVVNPAADAKLSLPWERYIKLNRISQLADKYLRAQKKEGRATILDISQDGALALFLPQYDISVLPWAGEKLLPGFDLVTAAETLDYCHRDKREQFLRELGGLGPALLTYFRPSAHEAMKLVCEITDSKRLGEMLKCGPVEDDFITEIFSSMGYKTSFYPHTSTAAWVSFAALRGLNCDAADMLSRYLVEHLEEEDSRHPLYQVAFAHY